MQKRTNFFDSSLFNTVPDKPLVIRNKPHNNQLCTDLSRFISAYPVVSHFLRFAWQTTAMPQAWRNAKWLKGEILLLLDGNNKINLLGRTYKYSTERGFEEIKEEES